MRLQRSPSISSVRLMGQPDRWASRGFIKRTACASRHHLQYAYSFTIVATACRMQAVFNWEICPCPGFGPEGANGNGSERRICMSEFETAEVRRLVEQRSEAIREKDVERSTSMT